MKIKFFIFSLLVLAYGAMLGYGVIYGHHFSQDVVFHHHDYDETDSQDGDCEHLPCLMVINPHFIASHRSLSNESEYHEQASPDFSLDFDLFNYQFSKVFKALTLDRSKICFPLSPETRGYCLRGPPLV